MDEHVQQQQQQLKDLTALPPISWRGSQVRSLEQLSDEAFWQYAFNAANSLPHLSPEPDTYVVCQMSSGSWLLPLDALHEIISASQPCTRLPATQRWMLGLMAWRGDIIAVIDLDAYLCTLQELPYSGSTHAEGLLLITRMDTCLLAFYINAIGETMTINEAQIHALSAQTSVADTLRPLLLGKYADTWMLDMQKLISSVMQEVDVFSS